MGWDEILKPMMVSTTELLVVPILIFAITGLLIKMEYFGYDMSWYFAIQLFSWSIYLHIGYLAANKFNMGVEGAAITGALAGAVYGMTTYFVPWQFASINGVINNTLMWGAFGFFLGMLGGEISSQRNLLIAIAAFIVGISILFHLGLI
jgi:hypothetical protein